MIIAGIVGGWKAGKPFDPYGLAALALFAAFLVALLVLILSSWIPFDASDLPDALAGWLELFLYGAVPFVVVGFLKAKRDRNREGE